MTRRSETLRAISMAATVLEQSSHCVRTSFDIIGAVAEPNVPLLFRPLDKLWGAFITVNDEARTSPSGSILKQQSRSPALTRAQGEGQWQAMNHADVNGSLNYICDWGDHVLRDLYVRGKYRDVILPMTVLRGPYAVHENTKPQAVEDTKAVLHEADVVDQNSALRATVGQACYNTPKFSLRELRPRAPTANSSTATRRCTWPGYRLKSRTSFESRDFRKPNPAALEGRRPPHADREAQLARRPPPPRSDEERPRHGRASRPRQPRHGLSLLRSWSDASIREQRGVRRAPDATRRGVADGEARLPAGRRRGPARHLPTGHPLFTIPERNSATKGL